MRSRKLLFAIICVTAPVVLGVGQARPPLDSLSWLSGCWEGRQGNAVIEEHWSKPAGQSMLGFSRTIKNNMTTSYEFIQIREEGNSLVYLPQPQGGQRVSFPLSKSGQNQFTFENSAHDFPQRIIYERKGAMLLAAIEGILKGKQEREEFLMKKVRCNEPINQ